MAYFCAHCAKELSLTTGQKVGRRESCPHCDGDLHCCKNCSHFDDKAYNQCKEPQADRVLEKNRSNYCDYFQFRDGALAKSGDLAKSKALQDLDSLFKK